mmetsp:Transcript_48807/g.153216  ORF Transcript_48807/g.153216 Transcript_48807/m.153216 type:complete len:90 (+) Transcript_48807:3458-3727(+)
MSRRTWPRRKMLLLNHLKLGMWTTRSGWRDLLTSGKSDPRLHRRRAEGREEEAKEKMEKGRRKRQRRKQNQESRVDRDAVDGACRHLVH